MMSRGGFSSSGPGERMGRYRLAWLIGLAMAAVLIAPASSWAQNTDLMVITPPAGSFEEDQYSTPIFPTHALTFTIAYDDTYYEGDSIQCELETAVTRPGASFPTITDTPWGSCGPVAPGSCPLSVCYSYSPPISQDAHFSVFTRLVDTNGDEEFGAGRAEFDFDVDTTPPRTSLSLSYINGEGSPNGTGRHASFTFSADDPNAHFQCSLSRTATPGPWKPCSSDKTIPFPIPVTTQLVHFSVRAVDPFGRADPSPPTYTFSAIPCRARVLTRARTLAALARHGMRVRITCVTPSAWHFFIEPTTPLARRLEIAELGGFSGVFRHAGQSRTITVKSFPLRDLPPQFASRPLAVAYVTSPLTANYEDFGAPQRIPGRLSPG
jgi:hypothetical protein